MEKQIDFTVVVKKGEKQFVALCPELDVVSQGYTVEDAIENLKEACELYIEEVGIPEEVYSGEIIVTRFGIKNGQVIKTLRIRSY